MIFQNNLFESEENDINKKKKKMIANKEIKLRQNATNCLFQNIFSR